MKDKIYDLIGIGIGPFNLGLACLAQPIESLDALFLDARESFNWHPGLLMESTRLQTPFLGDLVTLADPTSPYSFLNYAKSTGRLYPFYIRESFFLLRREYDQYCRWASEQLPSLRFGCHVHNTRYDPKTGLYSVHYRDKKIGKQEQILARKLVLGVGSEPHIPEHCTAEHDAILHASHYLPNKARLIGKRRITVVGSGQSAAEIVYDLLQDIDLYEYQLDWITRSPRFFPLEYTKLTLEMTSPEYIDYFHSLPTSTRNRLIENQKSLYKGANSELINAIYDLLYEKNLTTNPRVLLTTNSALTQVGARGNKLHVHFQQQEQGTSFDFQTQALILATGYRTRIPDFLGGIKSRIQTTPENRYAVARNYSVDIQGEDIFVQNAELYSHGLSAPDLGMGCYRNATIIRAITGHEYYPIERRIAYQTFASQPGPAEAMPTTKASMM